MKHLRYEEFTKLMKNRRKKTVVTNECMYEFTGITEHQVCVQIYFRLKEDWRVGETGYFVKFDRVISLTEAQCMYMSLE